MTTEYEYERLAKCPYCGHEDPDYFEYPFKTYCDGEEIEFMCGSCGKEFRLVLNVSYCFNSYPLKESKKEQL